MREQKPLVRRYVKVVNTIFLCDTARHQGNAKTQITNYFEKIKATVESIGSSMSNIVKVMVYLSDLNHIAQYLNGHLAI